eukprot:SAG31_NODE_2744_length_5150_cov_4.544249_4_plen_142_part_00
MKRWISLRLGSTFGESWRSTSEGAKVDNSSNSNNSNITRTHAHTSMAADSATETKTLIALVSLSCILVAATVINARQLPLPLEPTGPECTSTAAGLSSSAPMGRWCTSRTSLTSDCTSRLLAAWCVQKSWHHSYLTSKILL